MASTYKVVEDLIRLRAQADNLLSRDQRVIAEAIATIRKDERQPLKILDVGCADGYVTHTRFSNLCNVDILGVDKNKGCIEFAKKHFKAPKVNFATCDVEKDFPLDSQFDLIYSAYLLPHLAQPARIMQHFWDMLKPGGSLIIRAGDDGWKINYPDNPELEYLIQHTGKVPGSSDRNYGRKIYTHMKGLTPLPSIVTTNIEPESTVGMDSNQRLNFFDNYYSFRSNYVKNLIDTEDPDPVHVELFNKLDSIIAKQREHFRHSENIFSFNAHIMCIAYKGWL